MGQSDSTSRVSRLKYTLTKKYNERFLLFDGFNKDFAAVEALLASFRDLCPKPLFGQ